MAGHTYSANPLSAAVSLEVLSYIEGNDLVQAAEKKGQYLFKKLQGLAEKFDIIGDVRGKGLLLGLEFVSDRISKTSYSTCKFGLTTRLVNKAFAKGLLMILLQVRLKESLAMRYIISAINHYE